MIWTEEFIFSGVKPALYMNRGEAIYLFIFIPVDGKYCTLTSLERLFHLANVLTCLSMRGEALWCGESSVRLALESLEFSVLLDDSRQLLSCASIVLSGEQDGVIFLFVKVH